MTNEEDNELEEFIGDWYWNDRSHRYARDLAKYLFGFIDGLYDLGLNRKTVLKHVDNCWAIGYLECTYGRAGRSNFDPARAFYSEEAGYEYEFRRKFSDSNYALTSYRTTWRKMYKYTKVAGYVLDK